MKVAAKFRNGGYISKEKKKKIYVHLVAAYKVCVTFMSAFCGRLDTLGSMQASEELDDGQVRQMLFDLESSYNAFNNVLHDN